MYSVILADCPWAFKTHSERGMGRSAERHYPTMSLDEIKRLPVADVAAKDSVLFFWVTDPFIPLGLEVLKSWGFTYKTVGFYWIKTNADGGYFMGTGYYTRANCEQCWIATRGAGVKRASKNVPRLIVSGRREHSRKPDEQYIRIESLYPNGPYLELFARNRWSERWAVWGNQVENPIDLPGQGQTP